MKPYLLFGYDNYYAAGGWNDFLGSFESIAEAQAEVARRDLTRVGNRQNYQLVSAVTGEDISPKLWEESPERDQEERKRQ